MSSFIRISYFSQFSNITSTMQYAKMLIMNIQVDEINLTHVIAYNKLQPNIMLTPNKVF